VILGGEAVHRCGFRILFSEASAAEVDSCLARTFAASCYAALWPLTLHASITSIRGRRVPKFVIEREVPGAGNLSDAQWREISQKSVSVLKSMGHEIQWLHSYVTGDKVYCVYLAPDEATIKDHARRVGIPANRISAVRQLLDPTSAE
jgi:hypothetical protein